MSCVSQCSDSNLIMRKLNKMVKSRAEMRYKMDNSKIENLLNLALNSTMEEREKSENLNVGYNEAERTWEVIVKNHGISGG